VGRDHPSVVFCDLKLPKVDGIELLHRIRGDARTRTVPVVIFSSSVQHGDLDRAYRSGANSYVRKPVDARSFIEAVQQMSLYWLALNERIRDPSRREPEA
jgi:two-component system response regulator